MGDKADRKQDIYAFAACLYTTLSNAEPFQGDDLSNKILHETPLALKSSHNASLQKGLKKKAVDRPQSCQDLLDGKASQARLLKIAIAGLVVVSICFLLFMFTNKSDNGPKEVDGGDHTKPLTPRAANSTGTRLVPRTQLYDSYKLGSEQAKKKANGLVKDGVLKFILNKEEFNEVDAFGTCFFIINNGGDENVALAARSFLQLFTLYRHGERSLKKMLSELASAANKYLLQAVFYEKTDLAKSILNYEKLIGVSDYAAHKRVLASLYSRALQPKKAHDMHKSMFIKKEIDSYSYIKLYEYAMASEMIKESIDYAKKLVERSPVSRFMLMLAMSYELAGQDENAYQTYKTMYHLKSSKSVKQQDSILFYIYLLKHNKRQESEAVYNELKTMADKGYLWERYAKAMLDQGLYKDAAAAYKARFSIAKGTSSTANLGYAAALLKLGKKQEAMVLLNNKRNRYAAISLNEYGFYKRALETLVSKKTRAPTNKQLMFATAYAGLNQIDKAEKAWKNHLEKPKVQRDIRGKYFYARALVHSKNYKKAKKILATIESSRQDEKFQRLRYVIQTNE